MANSDLTVTASLDIPQAISQINSDLKKVQASLNKLIVTAKFDKTVEKQIRNLIQSLNQLQRITTQVNNQPINLNTQDNGNIQQILQRLDEITARINTLNTRPIDIHANPNGGLDTVNNELNNINTSAVTARQSLRDMLSGVGINVSAYQALRLIRQGIKEITEAIKEYDTYITNLRIITQKPEAEVNDLLADYAEQSIKMGVDISDYEQAAQTILRTGKSIADTNEILKDSIYLSKVGFIQSDEAATNLITIANAYNLEADAIENVVDKLLSLDTASQTQGGLLSSAVAKVAKTAQLAGVTLDSLTAQIANLRNTTGKTENEIATSLNAIYNRMYNVKLGKFIIEDESGTDDITQDLSDMEKILKRVDIQLRIDKDNFRDFDDILVELHNNWGKFTEVEQNAIAKTLGGTYHKNLALSMIQDYEDFMRLQDVTMNSAGTAAERYTAYTDSITAKSAELSTALKQLWTNTISGDFVKNVKEGTTGLVQFIDKFEILQNLLKSTLIYGAARGFIYLGGSVHDAYVSVANLSQAFNQLSIMRTSGAGTAAYNTAMQTLTANCRNLSDNQLRLVLSTNQLTQAQAIAILRARGLSQQEAQTTLATMGLTTAEGNATTATLSLSNAFKGLGLAIASNPVGAIATALMGIFTVMSVIRSKANEEEQAQQQLQQRIEQSIEKYQKEAESLESVIDRYSELKAKSQDLTEVKEDLQTLQSDLLNSYGDEANAIDLINGKYSEEIQKLFELKKARAEAFIYDEDNIKAYEQAMRDLNEAGNINGDVDVNIAYKGGISQEIIDAWKEAELIIDSIQYSMSSRDYGISIVNGEDAEQLYKSLEQMADMYKRMSEEAGTFDQEQYVAIKQQAQIAKDAYEKAKATADLFEKQQEIATFELSDDVQKQFNDLIDEANELNAVLNSDASNGEKYVATQRLAELQTQLETIAQNSPMLQTVVRNTFSAFARGADDATAAIEDVRNKWYEDLDEAQKQALKTVDNIDKAIKKISDGELLSHDEFWALAKEDTKDVLDNVKLINGQYYVAKDKLIAFKDDFVDSQIEMFEAQAQTHKQELADLAEEQELLNDQLKTQKAIIEAKLTGKGVSIPEFLEAQKKIKEISALLEENEAKQREYNRRVRDTTLLIAEWRSKLKDNTTVIEQSLQAEVTKYEKELEAIKATTQALQDRKKAVEAEKKELQAELEILNQQKETLEATLKDYDGAADAVKEFVKAQTDGIQSQIDALETEKTALEKFYDDQINALKAENEERDLAIKKEKALADLANAENQKVRTYDSARGWTWESKKEDVVTAQNAVQEVETEIKIKELETEKDTKLSGFDERKKEYETQIKAYEAYAEKFTDISKDIAKAENELLAEQILGADWRKEIEQQDEELLSKYRQEYTSFNNQLKNLVNTEIATLKDSISAKDAEINKISEEITAYNDYKSAVETNLNNAKSALSDYSKAVSQSATDVSNALETMEGNTWDRANKVVDDYNRMASAAESAKDRINNALDEIGNASERLKKRLAESATGYGIINSAGDARLLEGYSSGGIADFTGEAMLHGTRNKPEMVLNNTDTKKLYDLIHNTPNLVQSVAKQALAATGISNISNVTNHTSDQTTNINLRIDNITANNPQELTRNLDQHLDGYFRRKLTEGYVTR